MLTDLHDQKKAVEGWSIAVRLSGSAFKSWSIVVRENSSDAETEKELLDFKKGLQLKSNTMAIAMIPINDDERDDPSIPKTAVFRRVFSNISLVGIYNERRFKQFGVNSTICGRYIVQFITRG